jgi:hypothetical protein
MGFVEPIAVAVVRPSKTSSIARIVRWKDNQLANTIKKASEGQIYRAGGDQKIFAVSVGLPENFVKNRL